MAFIGVIVGAGFASGQEAMQYFVAFGTWGFAGALLAAGLMMISGIALLQLGSYYQAREHMAVLGRISNRIVSVVLDVGTVVTLFSIGFVMFAGGGSNLNQQFGLPVFWGALLMLVLVVVTGLLDVDKVTTVIGMITPFIIVCIVGTTVYSILTAEPDIQGLNLIAQAEVDSTLPNWWVSALNYTGLNVMTAVSMTIVIGGSFMDTKAAGRGGLIGGFCYLLMLVLLVFALFFEVETVSGDDMPVLSLITSIHPWLGNAMAIVVFGMIFNTAVSMFYALGRRLSRTHPRRYKTYFISSCLIGFVLSFAGFQQLVAYVYPAIGYIGILMVVVLAGAWLRGRAKIGEEGRRRLRAADLTRRKLDPRLRYTKRNQRELARLTRDSNIPDSSFTASLTEEVQEELENDSEIDYDRNDPDSTVVWVAHTKPE